MDVHNEDVIVTQSSKGGKPARPRDGRLRLSKELAESYGLSYRQLWRKARAGEIPGAIQDETGAWYVPVGADITRQRAAITPEVEERVKRAIIGGGKPAGIALREGISETTVYKIRERLHDVLREEHRQGQERRDHLEQMMKETSPEITALHRGVGADENTAILATDLAGADPKVLGQLVEVRGYFDPSCNTFYLPPEQVREIAEWEDAREKRLEERYRRAT